MSHSKKISPQAILALREALSVIFWKKEDLRDFLKLTLENNQIISTLDWNNANVTKREIVKELINRMSTRQDIFFEDLKGLLVAVSDFNDFSNLKYWDEDGSKAKKARESVLKLRNCTKGYIQLSKEEEESNSRKIESEKKIKIVKSLDAELLVLKERFYQLVSENNFQKRGYALETLLHDIFLLYELDPKGSFKNQGEQIDGAFTFQGSDFILEAKWAKQVDRNDLADFCHKVETKFKTAVGLFVTIDGVTKDAIDAYFKSIIIMDGVDIIAVLEGRIKLTDLLFRKRRRASETGNIY
ncbi:hypothetical protein SAMD00024442_48_23, partial [Candidatus Symbiothrix dinenymphae]